MPLVAKCAFKILMITKSRVSHYVSHFAAFFIVLGTKTSTAKSFIRHCARRTPAADLLPEASTIGAFFFKIVIHLLCGIG